MEGKRIGIVVGGAGAIPEAAIRMAQEHDVELVRLWKPPYVGSRMSQ